MFGGGLGSGGPGGGNFRACFLESQKVSRASLPTRTHKSHNREHVFLKQLYACTRDVSVCDHRSSGARGKRGPSVGAPKTHRALLFAACGGQRRFRARRPQRFRVRRRRGRRLAIGRGRRLRGGGSGGCLEPR